MTAQSKPLCSQCQKSSQNKTFKWLNFVLRIVKTELVFGYLGQINKQPIKGLHLGTPDLAIVEDDSTLDTNVLFYSPTPQL